MNKDDHKAWSLSRLSRIMTELASLALSTSASMPFRRRYLDLIVHEVTMTLSTTAPEDRGYPLRSMANGKASYKGVQKVWCQVDSAFRT
jgi:hypothetical protein